MKHIMVHFQGLSQINIAVFFIVQLCFLDILLMKTLV